MKRFFFSITSVVITALALGLVAVPTPAGATTVSTASKSLIQNGAKISAGNVVPVVGDTRWTAVRPGAAYNPHTLALEAEKSFNAKMRVVGGEVNTNASVKVGWFTDLLTLTRADLGGTELQAIANGYATALTAICGTVGTIVGGLIGALFSTVACAFVFALVESSIMNAVSAAYNNVTWDGAWWCGNAGHYNGKKCSAPGAVVDVLGDWIYPVKVTGLNILFTWAGIPIAWQLNPYASY